MHHHVSVEHDAGFEPWRFTGDGRAHLVDLYCELSPYPRGKVTFEAIQALARGSDCLLAVDLSDNGKMLGIARLVVTPGAGRHGEIHDLVVKGDCRRRGIGQILVKAALQEAKGRRLPHVELRSKAKRVEANRLFEKLGFRLIQPAIPGDEDSANVYRFELGQVSH